MLCSQKIYKVFKKSTSEIAQHTGTTRLKSINPIHIQIQNISHAKCLVPQKYLTDEEETTKPDHEVALGLAVFAAQLTLCTLAFKQANAPTISGLSRKVEDLAHLARELSILSQKGSSVVDNLQQHGNCECAHCTGGSDLHSWRPLSGQLEPSAANLLQLELGTQWGIRNHTVMALRNGPHRASALSVSMEILLQNIMRNGIMNEFEVQSDIFAMHSLI
ncbi:hypothetical protein TREMEDRAFT_61546 [Tremella mesenterica DSM 1558]|uniref:uncharacterized protein n=1 Tax=Tremella mesenterica (strain ATCC 24925 / CBS 8224 / DSM 1558 / NBRC 9311 / NRRL Y-6157 / RJB 2259-6 / UBC 559-6) TaxID=578456 RepID=UPI0003F496CF|nr:uncharacterized protein TREMEDRAFT_61546 [Tremella mesenterica DSM 1558]EIW69780.1 hypothetical protein TREMEDRAFT_61546 [Tremella mesenterica DSM 1558]